jgi:hypothetical protein
MSGRSRAHPWFQQKSEYQTASKKLSEAHPPADWPNYVWRVSDSGKGESMWIDERGNEHWTWWDEDGTYTINVTLAERLKLCDAGESE